MERSIFICYRREDSIAYAGRLFDHLGAHFGKDRVFMDVDAIEPGDDFIDVLERRVGACDALIAVIGKSWSDSRDSDGRRRLDDPEDYVRREISAALDRRVRVIPALVGGARMPRPTDLPTDISPLARRNAIEISDTSFPGSVAKLIETLEGVFKNEASGKRYDSGASPASTLQVPDTPAVPKAEPVAPRPHEPAPALAPTLVKAPALKAPAVEPAPARDRRLLAAAGAVLAICVVAAVFLFRDRVSEQPAPSPPSNETRSVPPAETSPRPGEQTPARPTDPPASGGTVPASIAPTLHVGTVTDAATGLPISGATIRINDFQALTSGRQGEFRFSRLLSDPNIARVQVSAPGYIAQSAEVDLSARSHHLFQLQREPSATARRETPASTLAATREAALAARRQADRPASSGGMTALRVGGNIKPPVKIKNVPPVYPPGAQAGNVQGIVIIEATIGPGGNVQQARVLRSIPLLDQAAIDAVQQWMYTPTMLNGTAVPVVMTVTVQFKLVDPRKEALEKYVDTIEAAKNVGAAMDMLNRVFHTHAGGWNDAVVFTTLRNKLAAATDAELTAAFTAIPQ